MIITNNKAYLVHEEDKTPHAFTQSDFEAFLADGEEQSLEKIYVPQNLLSEYQELNEFFASRMEPYNFNTKRVTKPEYYYFNELSLDDGILRKLLDGSVVNTVNFLTYIYAGNNLMSFPFDITREEFLENIEIEKLGQAENGIILPDGWYEYNPSIGGNYVLWESSFPDVIKANTPFMFRATESRTKANPLVFHNKTLKILQEPLLYRVGQTNWHIVVHPFNQTFPTEEAISSNIYGTDTKGKIVRFKLTNGKVTVRFDRPVIEQRNY